MIQLLTLQPQQTAAIQQAADILHRAFRDHWPEAWPTSAEALAEAQAMLAPDRICRVAIDDAEGGAVVGWIGGIPEYDGHVWELHPLAVRPDRQRQGLGRLLVQDFEAQVKARGGLTIMLGSDDENAMTTLAGADLYVDLWDQIARIRNLKGHPYEFYQRLGYTILGVMPDANGRGKPDIYLGKRVP